MPSNDLFLLLLGVGSFGALWGYVWLCART
jgi:hypothetical protein